MMQAADSAVLVPDACPDIMCPAGAEAADSADNRIWQVGKDWEEGEGLCHDTF